jgi:hypothetical protein
VRTGLVLFIINFLLISNTYGEIIVSFNYGLNQLVTKELNNRNGKAAGTSQMFKVGMLNGSQEIGLYSNTIESSVNITHDNTENELTTSINSVGGYLAFYKNSLYIEFGYGKASVKENIDSDLTGTSLTALKEIYDLNTDGSLTSTEARILLGFKLISSGVFTLTTYAQKIKMLETSHDSTDIGLELKVNI